MQSLIYHFFFLIYHFIAHMWHSPQPRLQKDKLSPNLCSVSSLLSYFADSRSPKLWSVLPQPIRITAPCSDSRSPHNGWKNTPSRKLQPCGAYLMTFSQGSSFALSSFQCLTVLFYMFFQFCDCHRRNNPIPVFLSQS